MSVALRCQPEHIHGFGFFRPSGEKAPTGPITCTSRPFARLPKRRRRPRKLCLTA